MTVTPAASGEEMGFIVVLADEVHCRLAMSFGSGQASVNEVGILLEAFRTVFGCRGSADGWGWSGKAGVA
jgi:hypothetical protein